MRSKEEAHDYRYFPEPDLMPIVVSDEWIESIRETLPELPGAKKERFMKMGLTDYEAGLISVNMALSALLDEAVSCGAPAKEASNQILGEISKILNERNMEADDIPFGGAELAELISLIAKGTISVTIAKKVMPVMFDECKKPSVIVEEKGLVQISDEGAIKEMILGVFDANPQAIADFKAGKKQAQGFLTGQIMRASKGKANPAMINKLLTEMLSDL